MALGDLPDATARTRRPHVGGHGLHGRRVGVGALRKAGAQEPVYQGELRMRLGLGTGLVLEPLAGGAEDGVER